MVTTISEIRECYYLAKTAEQTRIRIDQGLYAYARVFLSGWTPDASEAERKKCAARAKRVVDAIRKGKEPAEGDEVIHMAMFGMVTQSQKSWEAFDEQCEIQQKKARLIASELPAWPDLEEIRGFSAWGLAAIIGEAGDLSKYPGCRALYKRLGFAPDECYPRGEMRTGRKIPRMARGRIMGIIAEPLLRQQWRGEREGVPGHPIGPYGAVYADAKARHLASGKTKGHADKIARRAMVKGLLHDVHAAWHGREPMFLHRPLQEMPPVAA